MDDLVYEHISRCKVRCGAAALSLTSHIATATVMFDIDSTLFPRTCLLAPYYRPPRPDEEVVVQSGNVSHMVLPVRASSRATHTYFQVEFWPNALTVGIAGLQLSRAMRTQTQKR